MKDHWNGNGYEPESDLRILSNKKITSYEDSDDMKMLVTDWKASEEKLTDDLLVQTLRDWKNYNQIQIKSWDFVHNIGVGGTILRFENSKTSNRSDDFKFNIHLKGFQRNFAPNMDRLREEVDVDIMDLNVHGVERYSGATTSKSVQLLVTKYQNNMLWCWLAIADQMFIPLTNKWSENIRSRTPSLDLSQSNKLVLNIHEAIQFQRENKNGKV
jgi:hypothetical protein